MSARQELIKLEAMYYHQRNDEHQKFLDHNREYAWFRKVGNYPDGEDGETK